MHVSPPSHNATVGQDVVFVCTSTSTEPVDLTWLRRNNTKEQARYITNSGDGSTVLVELKEKYQVIVEVIEDRYQSQLTVLNAQFTDAGDYICRGSSDQIDEAHITVTGKAVIC